MVGAALALLVALVEPSGESLRLSTDAPSTGLNQFGGRQFGGVTATQAFQKVVAEMETAAEEKTAAVELAGLKGAAEAVAVEAA